MKSMKDNIQTMLHYYFEIILINFCLMFYFMLLCQQVLQIYSYFLSMSKQIDIKKALLAILRSNQDTRDIADDESMLNNLLKTLLNEPTNHLRAFTQYLEDQCRLHPKTIALVIKQLNTDPFIRQTLGEKITNLMLLFNIYESMDLLKNTIQMRQNRKKVSDAFMGYNSLPNLLKSCSASIGMEAYTNKIFNMMDDIVKTQKTVYQQNESNPLMASNGNGKTTIRTVLALDATGSMGATLQKTREIISIVFERIYEIINSKSIDAIIEMKIMVYRNYNSPCEEIIESTDFESSPIELKKFLEKVSPKGGWGNEALEVLFQRLNREDTIDQVILIGDAAPNTQAEVISKRSSGKGEKYWNDFGFPFTHIEKELELFQMKKCPVNSFYLNDGKGFKEISSITGGTANKFNISSTNATEQLINFLAVSILSMIGGKSF